MNYVLPTVKIAYSNCKNFFLYISHTALHGFTQQLPLHKISYELQQN
jgi:hypothetical protein